MRHLVYLLREDAGGRLGIPVPLLVRMLEGRGTGEEVGGSALRTIVEVGELGWGRISSKAGGAVQPIPPAVEDSSTQFRWDVFLDYTQRDQQQARQLQQALAPNSVFSALTQGREKTALSEGLNESRLIVILISERVSPPQVLAWWRRFSSAANRFVPVLMDESSHILEGLNYLHLLHWAGPEVTAAAIKRLLVQEIPKVEKSFSVGSDEPIWLHLTSLPNTLAHYHFLPAEQRDRLLQSTRELLGADDPRTLRLLVAVGRELREAGEYPRARELHQEAAGGLPRVLGWEHRDVALATLEFALTLRALGDLHGAVELQHRVTDLHQRQLGPDHPDTLHSIDQLADTLRAMGDFSGAYRMEEQVWQGRVRTLGEHHPQTLATMDDVGESLREMGDFRQAQELQNRLLALCREVLGPEHPQTIAAMRHLAKTCDSLGDLSQARVLTRTVLELRERLLGPSHPDTIAARAEFTRLMPEQAPTPSKAASKAAPKKAKGTVFVSYNQVASAKKIVTALRETGITVNWYQDLRRGSDYQRALEQWFKKTDLFLYVQGSQPPGPAQLIEVKRAVQAGLRLGVLRVTEEGGVVPPSLQEAPTFGWNGNVEELLEWMSLGSPQTVA